MVEFIKSPDKLVCFVNSETPPDKIDRFSVYTYKGVSDEKEFFQLCRYWYLHEDTIWYNVLLWEQICVPSWKQANFILTCDAQKAL